MDNKTKLQVAAKKISFLMQHQEVLPDLKEIATDLYPVDAHPAALLETEHPVYLRGAYDALMALIKGLEEKGSTF